MLILISVLCSREHWQADILSVFQRYRLLGCALNDPKIFFRNLTENCTTFPDIRVTVFVWSGNANHPRAQWRPKIRLHPPGGAKQLVQPIYSG